MGRGNRLGKNSLFTSLGAHRQHSQGNVQLVLPGSPPASPLPAATGFLYLSRTNLAGAVLITCSQFLPNEGRQIPLNYCLFKPECFLWKKDDLIKYFQ